MESLSSIITLAIKGIEFLFFGIIVKYIVLRWVAEKIQRLFMRFFVNTERTMAIWLHYKNKARNAGHTHDTPIDCWEGDCKKI